MAQRFSDVTVVTATALETRMAARELKNLAPVLRVGVGNARGWLRLERLVSCGIAGGVRADLATGTVVIPREIVRPSGERVTCDPELSARFVNAAAALGARVSTDPLFTSRTFIYGAEARAELAAAGFVAVDMESALLDAPRVAAVRVILDTPAREISPAWLHPWRAIATPSAWRDLPWLAREGPRCARLAARVVAAGL
ncbi:MAG: hypothetical protein JOZ38_05640 [Candidatus Eremiobacteraeota bacterium]|nr:hypothetical protein [Candidatus Eremiobacteraeota bacterium]